jgi:hypothetical protein
MKPDKAITICRIIITILGFMTCLNLVAQTKNPYYVLLHKGDSLYYNKNYTGAYRYYQKSFLFREHPRISDILNVAECALYLNKQKDCYGLFRKSILNGLPKNELESILKSKDKFGE